MENPQKMKNSRTTHVSRTYSNFMNCGVWLTLGSLTAPAWALPTVVEQQVQRIAAASECAKHQWRKQGKAPLGFIKGMALVYAKSYCEASSGKSPAADILNGPVRTGAARQDILARYDMSPEGEYGPLRSTYTFGIGLGMKESTGNTLAGRNLRVRSHSEHTAEAGLFQSNYGSSRLSPWFTRLDQQYDERPPACQFGVFTQGRHTAGGKTLGQGDGADYQDRVRTCPALATEYTMVLLRQHGQHFGPVNRRQVEYVPACEAMLAKVEDTVREHCDRR